MRNGVMVLVPRKIRKEMFYIKKIIILIIVRDPYMYMCIHTDRIKGREILTHLDLGSLVLE